MICLGTIQEVGEAGGQVGREIDVANEPFLTGTHTDPQNSAVASDHGRLLLEAAFLKVKLSVGGSLRTQAIHVWDAVTRAC